MSQDILVFLVWAPLWVLMALGILADRRNWAPPPVDEPEPGSARVAGLVVGLSPIPIMVGFALVADALLHDPAFIGLAFIPLPVVAVLVALDPHGPLWMAGFRFGLAVSILAYPAYVLASTAAGRATTIDALVVYALFAVTTGAAFFLGPTRR